MEENYLCNDVSARPERKFLNSFRKKFLPICCLAITLVSGNLAAQCVSAPGNPSDYGNNSWNVYAYDGADITLASAVYYGYYTQNTLGFDTQSADGWPASASPSASTGWSGCALGDDNFTTVHKRKGFPCGNYTVKMLGWDDSCAIFINGVEQWSCSSTSDSGTCDGFVGTFSLDADSEIEVRTTENTSNSFTALSLVNNTAMATAPTSILGPNVTCSGKQTVLTASGGSSGAASSYQWGTGSVIGDNVIGGQTSGSISVAPTATTTYWVRRINSLCSTPTGGISQTITVPAPAIYSNGSWSTYPDQNTPIIVTENLTLPSYLHVCSCQVNNGATIIVPSTVSLIVERNITVNPGAIILVENNGSILQIDDNAVNAGNISFKSKTTTMKLYDYNYWSSPVAGCTLQQLSPNTLYDKYFSFNPTLDSWTVHLYGTQIMEPGKGYIVRAPQGWSQANPTAGVYEGTFTGVPNNGIVQASINKGAGTYNLIGNPYPSAVDLDLFLTDPANAGIISGTVYLWTHNTAISNLTPGDGIYNYTRDDYAKYNITGGVRTATSAVSGGLRPTNKLLSGQSFFIEADPGLPAGTFAATFKNYMRIENEPMMASRLAQNLPPPIERNRVWISLSNDSGAYDETLLGYLPGATAGFDPIYDGRTFDGGNVVSFYSINGADNLSIQGKPMPFNQTDVVPLGYTTAIAGAFTINLAQFDGLFNSQDVFLTDNITGQTHSLKDSPVNFTTAAGTFNDRFELRFTNSALGVAPANFSAGLIVRSHGNEIFVDTALSQLAAVEIFDMTGRVVFSHAEINAQSFATNTLNIGAQMLLIKVTLTNGNVFTKKVILD